ncbi:probable glycosyltransferase At5g03795 [Prosopis cineraria]|uniref:probable glycosyltransferase At5g03795 n=1 Tax=Prosopis cineraria TaxID=364024 RepID=UPI002410A3AB|nr:probable glycosyltransferase At5g03795 [Prosopis cineraria]
MDRLSSYSQRGLLGSGSRKGLFLKSKPTWLALLSSYFILFYLYSISNFFIPLLHTAPADLFLESPPSKTLDPHPSPTTVRFIQTLHTNSSQSLKSFASEGAVGEALRSQRATSIGEREMEKNKDVYHERDVFVENYREMKMSLKIYVYPHSKDDPFANVLLPADEEPGGNYASESYFKKALMKSQFITEDPANADLFFMPFSIASLRHDRRVGVGGIQDFVRDYIQEISHKYPYWNRSGGSDHFYVACHSVGRSAMGKAPQVKFNAIQVVCSSSYFLTGYVSHKDACLPQIWPRKGNPPTLASSNRKKLAFFAGGMNSRERKELVRRWGNDSEIFAHAGRLRTPYADELLGSKFCLHAKGYEVNTARIGDSLYYGCVPVVVADYYDLPFADVLNWNSFSVVVNAIDIPRLKKVLKDINPEGTSSYTAMC